MTGKLQRVFGRVVKNGKCFGEFRQDFFSNWKLGQVIFQTGKLGRVLSTNPPQLAAYVPIFPSPIVIEHAPVYYSKSMKHKIYKHKDDEMMGEGKIGT